MYAAFKKSFELFYTLYHTKSTCKTDLCNKNKLIAATLLTSMLIHFFQHFKSIFISFQFRHVKST